MKNTPRDFFFHLGVFATLYLSAIALITLLFRMIDYAFPDTLNGTYFYQDPYSGPMRFAIASLIILVPLFLYLMWIVQRETRKTPERRTLGIRKWLTYITLFIGGVTIIGDLIALLNSFLGGTLAMTFLLKVLVLLVVVGIGFWYFFLDIRGYWQERERMSRIVGLFVLLAVVLSVIVGFAIMGSPSVQRELRIDQEQVNDLNNIQYQIVNYWQENERLPNELSVLENELSGYSIPTTPDGSQYTYRVTGTLSFELCAIFLRGSKEYRSIAFETFGIRGSTNWRHDAGEFCFPRTIDPDLIKPVRSF